jgi:thiol-disulfide isomerase/thioredoxin
MGIMPKQLFRLILILALSWTGVASAADNFTLIDAAGKSHSLAGYRGKWLIVNFWATWCPPCLEEIPDLVAIKESRKDLEVIGIAMEFQDAKQVMQFADGMFVNYPIVLGDRKISESIGRVDGLPTTFIYDPQGRLAERRVGKITRKQIERLIGGKKTRLPDPAVADVAGGRADDARAAMFVVPFPGPGAQHVVRIP